MPSRRSRDRRPADAPTGGVGEPASFERLVADHGELVRRSLLRAGVSEGAVDDAAQQVFLVAASKLASVPVTHQRAFLLGVALNVAAHARRGVARRREVDADGAFAEMLDGAPLPDEALDARRLSELVARILHGLPPELRVVLELVDIEDHTMAEVAERLAIPQGTVASRLRKARELMAGAVARSRPSRRLRTARRRFS